MPAVLRSKKRLPVGRGALGRFDDPTKLVDSCAARDINQGEFLTSADLTYCKK